jgi:hypothetical protein
MPLLTSIATDGIAYQGSTNLDVGWTDQSATPYSTGLESYSGPSSELFNGAVANGYVAWTCLAGAASSALSETPTTEVWVARFFAPVNAVTTYADYWITNLNSGTVTSVLAGLYSVAGTQLAKDITTYDTTNVTSTAITTGLQTFTWNTPYTLIGGTFYYFVMIAAWTSDAPSVAAQPASPVINVNLPAHNFDFATYSTSATMPASLTLTSLTASVLAKPFVGLR